jgi:hypothetical protein
VTFLYFNWRARTALDGAAAPPFISTSSVSVSAGGVSS